MGQAGAQVGGQGQVLATQGHGLLLNTKQSLTGNFTYQIKEELKLKFFYKHYLGLHYLRIIFAAFYV
jgi:hypothetical protein